MIELIGHPGQRLEFDLDGVAEERWRRIALFEVLELGTPFGKRYQRWSDHLQVPDDVATAVRDAVEGVKKRAVVDQSWKELAVANADVAVALAPVVAMLREFILELATTWKVCLQIGDEITVVDHRAIVVLGRLEGGVVDVGQIYRAGDRQHPEWSTTDRVSSVVKAFRAICLGRGGKVNEQDFCCPDPLGRRVSSTEWPTHFPPNCPPDALPDADGDVYHLVGTEKQNNFISTLQRPRTPKKTWSGNCDKAALSCFRTLAGALEMRRSLVDRTPLFRYRRIARLRLTSAHGKLARTGPTPDHHSLWLRRVALADVDTLYEILHEHDLEPRQDA